MKILASLLLLAVLAAILWHRYATYRMKRAAETLARRARMEAVHDEWICKRLAELPVSEDSND